MYLALARKYRPQRFGDLIGQPHITKTLQNAITMDKLYAGLIFSGMKGVGKTSAARILAKALNCEKGPASEPCNDCDPCKEITQDKSPDYIEIDGASNNGVEEIRNLKEKIKYSPFKNRFRVIVIDEVHMLSNSAWNALLKTIEEPPSHTYFVLATTDFHKIPATIVSRCQHFEFKRIPQEIIIKLLKQICGKEGITIGDYGLFLIAKASEGGLRDAKKILDQAIALSEDGTVDDQNVIDILGVIEEEIFINLTEYILTQNRKSIIQQVNDLAERGMDLRFFYKEFLKFLRDLMILKSLAESESLHSLNPENLPRLREMLKNVREIELLRYFNATKDLELTIKNTESPRIILEYLFLKLSYFPSLVPISELIDQVKGGGVTFSGGPAPRQAPPSPPPPPAQPQSRGPVSHGAPPPQQYNAPQHHGTPPPHQGAPAAAPAPPAPPAPADPMARLTQTMGAAEPLGPDKIKAALVERVNAEKPRWGTALNAAQYSLEGDLLVISIPGDFELTLNSITDGQQHFNKILHDVVQRKMEVRFDLDKSQVSTEKQKNDELRQDKKITNLMDTLGAKLVSVD